MSFDQELSDFSTQFDKSSKRSDGKAGKKLKLTSDDASVEAPAAPKDVMTAPCGLIRSTRATATAKAAS